LTTSPILISSSVCGREPVSVDILPSIDGVNFNDAWERRVEGVIDAETGMKAFFISKSDLIESKLVAGRLRDLADVEEIRASDTSQPANPRPDDR
jgi:hypothetical protein